MRLYENVADLKEDVVTKVEKNTLRWFGHVERISESRLTKGIYMKDVTGNAGRGHPRKTNPDLIVEVFLERSGAQYS